MSPASRPGRLLLAIFLLAAPTMSPAIEEPAYQVVQTLDDGEVRQYAPYVVAEVTLPGSVDDAGNQGFRILAGYIFGKNQGDHKLAMTAPVTVVPTGTPIEAGGPVTGSATPEGYVVQFVLPRDVRVDTAPVPLDPRIHLREVPGRRVAVIRYTGFWSDANYASHLARLKAAVAAAGLAWSGAPEFARYDPPFMPWFLRRNEIWLTLAPA